jgi:hypothetical protein
MLVGIAVRARLLAAMRAGLAGRGRASVPRRACNAVTPAYITVTCDGRHRDNDATAVESLNTFIVSNVDESD